MNWKYEDGRIYSTDENGESMCEATYIRKENGEIDIDHTYVNPILRGQGVAAKMMEAVAEYFKKEGELPPISWLSTGGIRTVRSGSRLRAVPMILQPRHFPYRLLTFPSMRLWRISASR